MRTAVVQARAFSQGALTNSPIFCGSLVKRTSGTTAKLSCKERITWLRMSSFSVPCSPLTATTMMVGMMARRG